MIEEEIPIELYRIKNGEFVKFVRYEEIEKLNNQLEKEKSRFKALNDNSFLVANRLKEQQEENDRLNIIINRIKSIYSSLCFSAPENNYIFIEQLGEVLQELKGSDKVE